MNYIIHKGHIYGKHSQYIWINLTGHGYINTTNLMDRDTYFQYYETIEDAKVAAL